MFITPEQVEFVHTEGYVCLRRVFSEPELNPLIEEINEEIDRLAATLVATGELTKSYNEMPFPQRLAAITRENRSVFSAIKAGNLCGPAVFALITNPKLLDIAEQFCGPELIASSVYRLRPKLPGDLAGCIPWHQDSAYFEPACDNSLIITCWIPLVDATRERGCLWILPRMHKKGVLEHRPHEGRVFLELKRSEFSSVEPVCVEANKGDVLIMTNTTPHSSPENSSDTIRWSIDVRYQSASLPTNAIASAVDRSPLTNSISACYPPESDFLVRSRERPNDVCRDPEEFRRLRQSHHAQPVTDRWNLSALGPGWQGYSETYRVKPSDTYSSTLRE